ncbi:MAG: helix-turn-helix domain-containing protein [Burkholderiales bacterium]|nr:helix-turn-helix domain-containing protein [Burkholderiales bacterium]
MSESEPVIEQVGPGRVLAIARADHNLSVADVSQQIKYSVRQIEAIESGDYSKLPGATFVRGMIRSYAKLLQIDPKPLLDDLARRDIPTPITVDLRTSGQEPFVEGSTKSNRVYALLSVAALVAVAVVAYQWWAHPLDTGEVVTIMPRAASGDANPAPSATATAPAPPPAPVSASVSLTPLADASPADTAPEVSVPSVSAPVPVPPGTAQNSKQPEKPAPSTVAAQDAGVAKTPAVAKAAGGGNRIALDFDQLSWVEIKQADGKILLSQLNPPGSKKVVEGVPPFEVVIGNAANVRMKYNDEAVDLKPYFKVDVARLTLE